MEAAVTAVEKIIGYSFTNKKLLEEALTHSSFTDGVSYERLEFLGDAVLGNVICTHIFLAYPSIDCGQLSLIRAANVSTEKLARVAVRHGLHRCVQHNSPSLVQKVTEFVDAVEREGDDVVVYGGSVKAPKVLADIVESITAAVFVDVGFDLQKLGVIIRGLLEPIVTLSDLEEQPQPVTMLYKICQKNGKQVDIKHWRNDDKSIAGVYVDGELLASASSDQKDIARLDAAKDALHKLAHLLPASTMVFDLCTGVDGTLEIEQAKMNLHKICVVKKWPKPVYSIEKDEGPPHEKKFVCSVKIATSNGILQMLGDEKSRVKDAEQSAASLMITALQEFSLPVSEMAESKPGLRKPVFTKVDQLRPGTSGHTLTVKVVSTKMVMQKGRPDGPQPRQMRIAECMVGDETGVIIFTARNDQVDLMKEGSTVILRNAKIDMFKGSMRLAVDKWGRVEVTEPAEFTVKEDNNLSLIEYELVNVVE